MSHFSCSLSPTRGVRTTTGPGLLKHRASVVMTADFPLPVGMWTSAARGWFGSNDLMYFTIASTALRCGGQSALDNASGTVIGELIVVRSRPQAVPSCCTPIEVLSVHELPLLEACAPAYLGFRDGSYCPPRVIWSFWPSSEHCLSGAGAALH